MYRSIKEIIEVFDKALPKVAWYAGRNVYQELSSELWEIRERTGGHLEMLEKAIGLLSEYDRQITENRAEWLRLRRDATTEVDPQKSKDRLTDWWLRNAPKSKEHGVRRLIKRHPPELGACREVYLRKHHKLEQKLEYLILFVSAFDELSELSKEMATGFLDLLWAIGTRPSYWSTRVASFKTLHKAISAGLASTNLVPRVIQQICNDDSELAWVRSGALEVFSLLDMDGALRMAMNLFEHPATNRDGFLARRAMLRTIASWGKDGQSFIARVATKDPSPAVRQQAIVSLINLSYKLSYDMIHAIARDPSHQVRGAWALSLLDSPDRSTLINVLTLATVQLAGEQDDLLLSHCLRVLAEFFISIADEELPKSLLTELDVFAASLKETAGRRDLKPSTHSMWWLAAELADILASDVRRPLLFKLRQRMHKTRESRSFKILVSEIPDNLRDIEVVLCCLAALDFGLFVKRGKSCWRVQRGQARRFKLWRFFHEITHFAYDKRKGHHHVTGLNNGGDLWFPSLLMAEVTRTRIPGEKVYLPHFGHWVPHVPGPTEATNTRRLKSIRIVLPGAEIALNRSSVINRLKGQLAVSLGFAKLDDKRFNALKLASGPAISQYIDDFENQSGLSMEIRSPHKYWESQLGLDKVSVPGASLFSLDWLDLLAQYKEPLTYFITPFANTLTHLGIFLGFYTAYVFGHHIRKSLQIKKWRNRIPLSIGGWGSRGKSGSERLKAGLFHGLGYRVFSKTTGTQAMFISSLPGIDPIEVPIYRPYDKATIWEQIDMVHQASLLDAQVFLWECMALNPRYVSILTHDWMFDDVATITNTYPDHEDIQGPTGDDVARTISLFVPKKSKLISSETQMVPILEEQAIANKTHSNMVPQVISHLLPDEFIDRFPYLEHPLNIAMCLVMANQLDVESDIALTMMADYILADVGSLRTYPMVELEGVNIDFTNIMSANERAGFLSSYERIGFHDWKDENRIAEKIVLVVNNRADRPARSHVFAKVLVEDTANDGIVVVGSAVKEFKQQLAHYTDSYLERNAKPVAPDSASSIKWLQTIFHSIRRRPQEASEWRRPIATWFQCDQSMAYRSIEPLYKALYKRAKKHTGPFSSSNLKAIYEDQLDTIELASNDLATANVSRHFDKKVYDIIGQELAICAILQHYYELCRDEKLEDRHTVEAASLVKLLIFERVVTIEDPNVSADGVMRACIDISLPGATTRTVGIQNIKGPGLKFVQIWNALETMHLRTGALLTGSEYERQEAIEWLLQLKKFSPFEAMVALKAFRDKGGEDGKRLGIEEKTMFDKMLDVVNFYKTRAKVTVSEKITFKQKFFTEIDKLIDFRDSVSRKQGSQLAMKLLTLGLISHTEAAERLEHIYERQKKGRFTASKADKN